MKRFLSERLKTFLDEEFEIHDFKNPLECLLDAAQMCVGIQEVGGDNRGPMVEAFQSTIGGANGESWCLSFIQALLAYVENRFGVFSNIPLTEHCLTMWNQAPTRFKLAQGEPIPGDIIVWQYGNTSKGHCGLVIKNQHLVVESVEGNTSMGPMVVREGNGVEKKIRSKKGSDLMRVVGFVRIEFTPIK